MTTNHTELCERLRDGPARVGVMRYAADLIESQAARIAELEAACKTLERARATDPVCVKWYAEQFDADQVRIAELEKERDDLIHDNAQLLKAANAEATLASEALAERDALKVDAERIPTAVLAYSTNGHNKPCGQTMGANGAGDEWVRGWLESALADLSVPAPIQMRRPS